VVTFRTDATPNEIAAAGAQVLEAYDAFTVAQGPADAVGRLVSLGKSAVPLPALDRVHLLARDVSVRDLRRPARSEWITDTLGQAAAVVHFHGPIKASWRTVLEARGVEILRYLPTDAFLVRGTPTAIEALGALPFVDGVGAYEPAWKVRPGMPTEGLVGLRIVVLPGTPPESVQAWLAHRGVPPRADRPMDAGIVGVFGPADFRWVQARIDATLVPALAAHPGVEFIDRVVPMRVLNAETDWVLQTDRSGDYRYWTYGLDGSGQVLGMADTGLDYDGASFRHSATQITVGDLYNVTDLSRRKVVRYVDMGVVIGQLTWPGGGGLWDPYSAMDCAYDGGANGHGTAVASTLAGNDEGLGSSPNDGLARNAKIYLQDIGGLGQATSCSAGEGLFYLPQDYAEILGPPGLVYNDPVAPVRIHSNSWGSDTNVYDVPARQIDAFLWAHPDMAVFFAVGNAGPQAGTVGTPATAKNVVSVGGAYNPDGNLPGNENDLAGFGSRGPNADGRLAPLLLTIADGDSATSDGSPWSGANLPDHHWAGTSYATPAAAAAAAIVRQYFTDGWYPSAAPVPANGFAPSAALIRAVLLASGAQITGSGTTGETTWPNQDQGFGRILLSNVLPIADAGDTFRTQVVDATAGLLTGEEASQVFRVVPGATRVRFVLTWTDYPGTLGAAKELVNDLDLEVTAPDGTVYRGNNFGPFAQGQSVPGGTFDTTNPFEAVLLKNPQAGDWKVRVIGANVPVGPQPFALVVTGGIDASYGRITLDRTSYRESDVVRITVEDGDATAVQVRVASSLEPTGELLNLSQAAPGGLWRGTIPTAFGQPAPDGVLQVRDGDRITVLYQDPSPPHLATATARIDGTPAAISGVVADRIGPTSARIRWTTDVPARSEVRFGTDPTNLDHVVAQADLVTDHALVLTGLEPDTRYTYDVVSRDAVGHETQDANGGRHYTFRTAPWGDVLLVIGDATFPEEREASYAAALDSLGWTWSLWRVPELGLPPLSLLQERRAVIWQVGLEQYPAFNGSAQALVKAYLDGGGRLLVSSHDATWSLASTDSPWYSSANAAWVAGVLKASFICDPSTTSEMEGVSGDPMSGAFSGGIPYEPHRTGAADDEVAAVAAGGTGSVTWTDSTSVQGCTPKNRPSGLRWVSSSANGSVGVGVWGGIPSRLAYFAFEITGLDATATDLRPNSSLRAQVLDNALRWLVGLSTTALDRDHPDVTVTSPTGGSFAGPTIPINWTATAYGPGITFARFTLSYSPDAGQTWEPLGTAAGTNRSFTWDIGSVPNGGQYLVRVTAEDSGTPGLQGTGTTNAAFAIARIGGDVLGPVIRAGSLRISPNPPGAADPVRLDATADDTRSGGARISGAEFFFGNTMPIGVDGTGLPMSPADGNFNASVEAVTWSGTLAVPPGTTCVWVHARDAAGNWGPFNATCFPVLSVGADTSPPGIAALRSIRIENAGADLVVAWDPAWDDGLFGGTAGYRVLRAPGPRGPFADVSGGLTATGNASYSFRDAGRGADASDYFYRIETFDAAGNTALSAAVAVKVHVAVAAGLNLLGLPAEPGGLTFQDLAQGIPWREVYTYDACGGSGWAAASPGDAAFALSAGQGFWLNATAAGDLVVLGIVAERAQVSLCTGWNLVALPGFSPGITVADLRAATGATAVVGFDAADAYRTRALADAEVLEPGRGYWVLVPAAATWVVAGW